MLRWFTRWWWSYLLDGCAGIENFVCRARFHPNGVVWHSSDPDRFEPDMRCKDCGEDLG